MSLRIGDRVIHKQTGGEYVIVAFAKMECSGEEVVVYKRDTFIDAGVPEVWVRPRTEFKDGRFVRKAVNPFPGIEASDLVTE